MTLPDCSNVQSARKFHEKMIAKAPYLSKMTGNYLGDNNYC